MKKRMLSMVMALVLLVLCIPFGALSVSAGDGTSPRDAIVLKDKQWYTREWTRYNHLSPCYNKITVPVNGYIQFIIEKPIKNGEVENYNLSLYNSSGDIIWEGSKSPDKDIFNDYYVYNIGLKKGTYYMHIDPGFSLFYSSASFFTDYRYIFKKSSTHEKEGSNTIDTATTISLNQRYSGFLSENSADTDYYKCKLVEGKKYTISIKNINPKDACVYFHDPSGDIFYFRSYDDVNKEKVTTTGVVWTYVAKESGYHYIEVWDRPDKDITYTVRVDTPKTSISKLKVSLSETAYTYNGKVKKPSVIVKTASGTKLSSSNYTVTYSSGCKNAGTYKVTIKMKGNYTGTKTLTYKIKPVDISKCKISLSTTAYTYDGKVKKPTVTVKNANGTKLSSSSYTVTYASGCKNVGTYKVTIKMKGNYTGTKTLTFKINPTKTSISKLTGASKSLKVTWSKKTAQVTGYEIQYSTSKSFSSYKSKLVTSNKTTSATIKSLSAKKTYYVRVRTYKTVNGKKVYSGWSAVKSVKTK